MTATTGRSVGEVHTWMSGCEPVHINKWSESSFISSRRLCQNTLPALVVLVEGLIVIEECLLYVRMKV